MNLIVETKLSVMAPVLFLRIMLLSHALVAASILPAEQQVFETRVHPVNPNKAVRDALLEAEIIPTVLDDFKPTILVGATWRSKNSAQLGNTLKPKKLQEAPSIQLTDLTHHFPHDLKFTIAMTDPDAPSRDDPKWSEMCHWIATNVSLTSSSSLSHKFDQVIEYKPPGPPPRTGQHRYVIVAFAPANLTAEPLHLIKPETRQHWGFDEDGLGVKKWAAINGLIPVGANFIYAENKKQ